MTSQFNDLPLSADLKKVMQELGFQSPTPIQEQSLLALLEGRDLIGQSKTGSGKTLAYTLPILQKIDVKNREVQALIMCPTRELCAQVAREIRKVARYHVGLQVLVAAGGIPGRPQAEALSKGVHIVVGTPGRILDHIRRQQLQTETIKKLVLDEADRMLDMGFEEDMKEILEALPKERQNIFFSATYPPSIERISKKYQQNPVWVKIEAPVAEIPHITHIFVSLSEAEKSQALLNVLQEYKVQSGIVFCNLKVHVFEIVKILSKAGIACGGLSGDLDQFERDQVMAKFRNGTLQILVATDVAARGLDVQSLSAVINFDVPFKVEEYIHRCGRTGRAGMSGTAVSLCMAGQRSLVSQIENTLKVKVDQRKISDLMPLNLKSLSEHIAPKNPMSTLMISGGRKQKLRPGDILGALTGEAGGLDAKCVGKIEIHDHFCYVAVSRDLAKDISMILQRGQIKGRKFSVQLLTN